MSSIGIRWIFRDAREWIRWVEIDEAEFHGYILLFRWTPLDWLRGVSLSTEPRGLEARTTAPVGRPAPITSRLFFLPFFLLCPDSLYNLVWLSTLTRHHQITTNSNVCILYFSSSSSSSSCSCWSYDYGYFSYSSALLLEFRRFLSPRLPPKQPLQTRTRRSHTIQSFKALIKSAFGLKN